MGRLNVRRWDDRFVSDNRRVITRFFLPGGVHRIANVIRRVLDCSEAEVSRHLTEVREDFGRRHKTVDRVFLQHYQKAAGLLESEAHQSGEGGGAVLKRLSDGIDENRRLLVGAYFTHEYSIEAAAFFNPSIVLHPSQGNVPANGARIVLSFRAVGEGHISSIVFRSGILTDGDIAFDPVTRFVETPAVVKNPEYDRRCFALKLRELGAYNVTSKAVLAEVGDFFAWDELLAAIRRHREEFGEAVDESTIRIVTWLAEANYQVRFDPSSDISERVLFPVSENERMGMEDARFVRFLADNGESIYYATYTAYGGADPKSGYYGYAIFPQLIETRDFLKFRVITLNGKAAEGKGMALFPRKVDGKFMMIGRQDGENLYIMASDNLHFWHEKQLLDQPREWWEFIQIGNCGSPIETDRGWLLLTHGVGPMRQYAIGAILLDRQDPSRVVGRLREPLLVPSSTEREGYVPNVVYTCGALLHEGQLVIPYAMSDVVSGIATVPLDDVLGQMQ